MFKNLIMLIILSAFLSACSDSGSSSDTVSPIVPPPPPANTTSFSVNLTPSQVIGNNDFSSSSATGNATANLTIDNDDNSLSGTVTVTGITGSGVSLRKGFAGEIGTLVFDLNSDGNNQWSVPVNTVLSQEELDSLNNGSLYLQVTTSTLTDGALRSQILVGDTALLRVELSAIQSIPLVNSSAVGTGYLTYDTVSGDAVAHINSVGIDDAVAAHIHNAIAGLNGSIVFPLEKDTGLPSHWFANDIILDATAMSNLNSAAFYFNVHTPANTSGEIRGQIIPTNYQVIFTELSADQVIKASGTVSSSARAVAATTFVSNAESATFYINTSGLDDATSVSLNQAPAGQNGPVVIDLVQDSGVVSRWSAENVPLMNAQLSAFNNQGLYFNVSTPAEPEGEVRGQLLPTTSMPPANSSSFQVTATSPASGASLDAFPNSINITFNRAVLDTSVSVGAITIAASGGDSSFGEANDVAISGFSTSVNDNVISLDVSGIVVDDDVFQVSISNNLITDSSGIILDGDADGNAGGAFSSNFNVTTPPVNNATLSNIQTSVFTPICTECHGGASPSAGLNLTAGQAFSNLVNRSSVEVPALFRVAPNDPNNSYLVQKIEGTAAVGGRMPLGGAPLNPALIQTIRQWIADGALNN